VRVHVVDRLPGLRASIEHHSVTGVGDAFCDRHLPGVGDQLRQQVIASLAQISQVRMVDPRDYQHMDRRLRIYVSKGNCAGIRRHYRRRYLSGRDTTEQAIRHGAILTSGPPARSSTYMVAMLRTRAAAPWGQGLASCWLSSLRDWSCARARAWLVRVGGWEVVWNRGLATPCRNIRE
jgi:hypothetical protein